MPRKLLPGGGFELVGVSPEVEELLASHETENADREPTEEQPRSIEESNEE